MSNLILALTLLAVIWYTVETYKLRKATTCATHLEFRPVICLSLEGPNNDLFIANVGRGHAMNVESKFVFILEESAHYVPIDDYIGLFLKNHKCRYVELISGEKNRQLGELLEANLDPRVAVYNIMIIVQYSDISGVRYSVKYQKDPGTPLQFIGSEKLKKRDERIVDV